MSEQPTEKETTVDTPADQLTRGLANAACAGTADPLTLQTLATIEAVKTGARISQGGGQIDEPAKKASGWNVPHVGQQLRVTGDSLNIAHNLTGKLVEMDSMTCWMNDNVQHAAVMVKSTDGMNSCVALVDVDPAD